MAVKLKNPFSLPTGFRAILTWMFIAAWVYPVLTTDWHRKKWYFGPAGALGTMEMDIGLLQINIIYYPHLVKHVPKLGTVIAQAMHNQAGLKGMDDLYQSICHQQEATKNFIRGCDTIQMLYLTSFGTIALIGISLVLLIFGSFFVIYFEMGNARANIKKHARICYFTAPLLQLCAIGLFAAGNFDLNGLYDFPALAPGFKFAFNSPNVFTMSYTSFMALGLALGCFTLPFWITEDLQLRLEDEILTEDAMASEAEAQAYAQQQYQEFEAQKAGYGPQSGYGAEDQYGQASGVGVDQYAQAQPGQQQQYY